MGHPAEGEIRAFLDGEAEGNPQALRAHLDACGRCGELAELQSRTMVTAAEALSILDVEPGLERARARILRREADGRRPGAMVRRNLPRAASFVILLTAGAAAALPGSPVRRWVARGWEAVSRPEEPASFPEQGLEAGVATEGTPEDPRIVGATVPLGPGGLELDLRNLGPDASLRILFVEGTQAGIFAGEGTQFRSETGRLVASNPPGDVTVEVPLRAPRVLVTVNGETYLRKTERGLELLGPVRSRTPTEVRFGPSEPGTNGFSPNG
ncbi:MAG: hypothetical protein ACWGSQ_10255 [Longimicrobiales bacterium]